jgi:sterol desaturase/sphingolipid hydroxylase (fatty acid hydroxylase superfamily)
MPLDTLFASPDVLLRLSAFVGVLAVMAIWETLAPRRRRAQPRRRRWPSNLGIAALNTVLVRVLFPAAAVGTALSAQSHGWGLLNQGTLPGWAAAGAGIVLLDLIVYLQHVMFHAVPALWRLHRVHHADLDIDVTTGARFHPVEIGLSMIIKLGAVAALGVPPQAVIAFEVLLNAGSLFNHANARIPGPFERLLRWLVVTPDMHRVHHSIEREETNSNFGFNLSLWDRLFGTYRAQPHAGHEAMRIGIPEFRDPGQCSTLGAMLALPFTAPKQGAGTVAARRGHKSLTVGGV